MAMTKQTSGETKRLALAQTDQRCITLSARDFSEFSEALGGVFKPNRALKDALASGKKLVHRV